MKKTIVLAAVISLFAGVYVTAADSLDGTQIAKMAENANESQSGVVTKGYIELKNLAANSSEKRAFVILAKSKGEGKQVLFRFTDSSYKGTTFFAQSEPGGAKTSQYIFLKSVGSPRQIEASDKEKNFVDTDASNEELGGAVLADYNYNRIADAKVDGADCYVLEKTPKKASKYQKHIVSIDKATMIPLMVKSYGRDGRVVKTIHATNIKKVGAKMFVPYNVEITDIEKKHRTVIAVSNAAEKNISSGYFSKTRMNAAWAEE